MAKAIRVAGMMFKPPPSMSRIIFAALPPENNEQRADGLRALALSIEEAMAKRRGGVSFDYGSASMIKHALMDLADRVELD